MCHHQPHPPLRRWWRTSPAGHLPTGWTRHPVPNRQQENQVTEMYVKNSSPTITRQVVLNILDAMRDADLDIIHRETLEAIVKECDRTLAEWQAK